MKILLIFDRNFPVDTKKLLAFLRQNSKHVSFELHKEDFLIRESIVNKPSTFDKAHQDVGKKKDGFDKVFCFTTKQYSDNYFFHEHKRLTIFSFYAWSYLTNLPVSNGVVYFIIDFLALIIDPEQFRHQEITGCVYDFLKHKRGVDDGMRQARFCSNCLQRINKLITDQDHLAIFEDLKKLMDLLSNASRWNNDILELQEEPNEILSKRSPKKQNCIQVVIASPGDTLSERQLLLESLERKFRIDNHENHCGFRLIVSGWEDLASQNGYAQNVINKKIIAESDFVIAIFKHKLGTPTRDLSTGEQRAESGTAEELLLALSNAKKGHPIAMAYFFSKAPIISLDSQDKDQIEKEWNRLSAFKKSIKDKMIYKPYTDNSELLSLTLKDLEKNILDYIQK